MGISRFMIAIQAFLLLAWSVHVSCPSSAADEIATGQATDSSTVEKFVERKFSPSLNGQWIGQGISYGAYREEESPGGLQPTQEELVEDLNIISQHWNLIRMYGSQEVTEDVLKIIHEQELPLRVMVGAWIEPEGTSETVSGITPAAVEANRNEVATAIRLANEYPDEVIAISVGNETQVFWSDHKTAPDALIGYIRQVRGATPVPVTTADDFNFWNKVESNQVADEIDFIVTHIHAMWAGLELTQAMEWTEKVYTEVKEKHPGKMVVIGEAGWATQVHNEGEQAQHIKGKAGEEEQREYYHQFTDWARKNKIVTFFFEVFDEPWKGGPHPNEVEKHWGVYSVNREPKAALAPLKK